MAYVDEELPNTCFDFFQLLLFTLGTTVLVCTIDPYSLLAVLPALVVFTYIRVSCHKR